MNWVENILTQIKHVETPKVYLKWSLYSAISAVAAPHISLNKGGAYDLSPNIYVMLLGDSGLGKGFGPWIAKSLVKTVDNTRIFSGRNSIQKIVSDLSLAYTRKEKEMIKDARAFLASGEFINFLLKDDQAISILTEWYDTHYVREWENSLKSSGVEKLKDVCITILGASNDEYLREAIPAAAVKGGFFGRFLFIFAKEKAHVNALIDAPTKDEQVSGNFKTWATHLEDISKIKKGSQFEVTQKARDYYRIWYHELQAKIRTGSINDKTGYIHRIHDHALKVGMVLSLAESTDLLLKRDHVEEGILLCEDLLSTVKKTTLGMGLSVSAPKNEVLLRALFKAPDHILLRRKILQNMHNEFDSTELDKITLTLEDGGLIKQDGNGKETAYRLTPLGRKEFLDRSDFRKVKQ